MIPVIVSNVLKRSFIAGFFTRLTVWLAQTRSHVGKYIAKDMQIVLTLVADFGKSLFVICKPMKQS